jgi:hypothetical protein
MLPGWANLGLLSAAILPVVGTANLGEQVGNPRLSGLRTSIGVNCPLTVPFSCLFTCPSGPPQQDAAAADPAGDSHVPEKLIL